MRRRITLADAIDAADELASALLGYNVAKTIDPTTPGGFVLVSQMVADKLAQAAAGSESQVVQAIIAELDYDWALMSDDAVTSAVLAIRKAVEEVYAAKVLPKIAAVFEAELQTIMGATRLSLIAREQLDISASLSQRDIAAEVAIRRSQTNFIRHSTGQRADALSEKARALVERGLEQGLGTSQIASDLQETFGTEIPRPGSYWKVVADAFVGTGRTASQIGSYEDAGVETYEIVAVLDEVTTDICRMMDGRTFTVSSARKVLDSINTLTDPEQVKFANPWVRSSKGRLYVPHADGSTTTIATVTRSGVGSVDDRGEFSGTKSNEELAKLGVPVPPFHGRCRTTIVAGAE